MSEQQFTDEDRKAASYCREAAEANPKGSRGDVAEAAFLAGVHYARNLARPITNEEQKP